MERNFKPKNFQTFVQSSQSLLLGSVFERIFVIRARVTCPCANHKGMRLGGGAVEKNSTYSQRLH
jgi:hypothetical protein